MTAHSSIRSKAAALLAGLSLLLTGCFITPGKFTSELQLIEENQFTFTYEGEIFFLAMADLAELGGSNQTFQANCWDDETFEERECTAEEEAQQRTDWEAGAEAREAKRKQEAEQMAAIFGGINPTDPEASAELIELLMRQKGWNRIEDKGDGVFDISYSITGSLTHDYMFPVIEGVPTTSPFVQLIMRDNDIVRINAPGFASPAAGGPLAAFFTGMPGLNSFPGSDDPAASESEGMPNFPEIEGTFRIVTGGKIRANNTDEGSVTTAEGEVLTWEVSSRTATAPTALIDMSR
ncbi:MAG: hypothetical protein AAGK01_05040 [Pseudomonadota bacterium]